MFSPTQLFIIVGLVLVLAELVVGIQAGFDLVLVGSILILSGFLGGATNSLPIALVTTIVLAILYILFGRSIIKQKITVLTHKTNIDKLVGQKGIVIRSITPDTAGLVRIDDEDWRATSNHVLYEKDRIEITGIEGVTLTVKKHK